MCVGGAAMPGDASTQNSGLKVTALPPARLADILRRAGARHASLESIQADIDAGAPANEDGTINLIEYVAWLAARMASHDDSSGRVREPGES